MNNEIKNKYNEIAESIGNLLESIGDELNGMGSELSLNQKDDITEIVREEVENIDIDDKVYDALDNNSEIMNRDNVDEAISNALYDHDWSQVVSDEDLVRNSDLDERIEECFDDRMFCFFRNMMVKVFEDDMNDWRTRLERAAVSQHIAKENEAKENEAKEESPVLTPEQV
tara:strand:- start:726 stop:1238 length:513 start_codon:yes stop_codon:yes gene_type:complete